MTPQARRSRLEEFVEDLERGCFYERALDIDIEAKGSPRSTPARDLLTEILSEVQAILDGGPEAMAWRSKARRSDGGRPSGMTPSPVIKCIACGRRVPVPVVVPPTIFCPCGKPLDGGPGSKVRNGEVLSWVSLHPHRDGSVYIPER